MHAGKTFGNDAIPLDAGLRETPEIATFDAELQHVRDAWPKLPAALRAGILAMIDAARK